MCVCRCLLSAFLFTALFFIFLSRKSGSKEGNAHPQTTQTEHNELGWPPAPSPCKPTPKSEHRRLLSIDGRKVGYVRTNTKTDNLTDTGMLHLNAGSFLMPFSSFLHSLQAFAPRVFHLIGLVMSNCDRGIAWISGACCYGFTIYKNMFSVSDAKVTRLFSLCWQLWPRHAVPHAPFSHVPAAWWAGGRRRDGEGAHSSHPRGSIFPCCCIL